MREFLYNFLICFVRNNLLELVRKKEFRPPPPPALIVTGSKVS